MSEPGTNSTLDLPAQAQSAQQAFQDWQSGNQQAAFVTLSPHVERNESWALALTVWLHMQQGLEGFKNAVPYAIRAVNTGMPWVAHNLLASLLANVPGSPDLVEPAHTLIAAAPFFGATIDPVGPAWTLLSQGRSEEAVRLMSVSTPYPLTAAAWQEMLDQARGRLHELATMATRAGERTAMIDSAVAEGIEQVGKRVADVETSARQAEMLVSSINSDAANALYHQEAERNEKESRFSWRTGIGVLIAAALVAVLPLVLHYFGTGPDYSIGALLGAHAGSTAALGAVAGVLLARARSRDHAGQRARDLATAMGTMISYSNQIRDEDEKQRFMLTMGQLVLQAHLRADSGGTKEDPLLGAAALMSAMRQTTQPSQG